MRGRTVGIVGSRGACVLVDRLWPRGMTRGAADVDLWHREIAPSTELRRWYGQDVARWPEFRERYRDELATRGELLDRLMDIARREWTVTLVFAARDETDNEAEVLAEVLRESETKDDGQGLA